MIKCARTLDARKAGETSRDAPGSIKNAVITFRQRLWNLQSACVPLSDSHIASILYLFLRSILRSIERQSFLQWFLDARHNCSAKERIGQADASVFVFVKWISKAFAAVFYSDWKKYLLRSIFFSVAFFFFFIRIYPSVS